MPNYDPTIQEKLDDLQALTGAQRKPSELVAIYWPQPGGLKIYASAMYTELPWWPDLAAAIESYFGDPIPITLTLIPDGTPFIDLPRAASISDDSINLTFSDLDDEFSDLLMDHGEGIRTEVFAYWPAVDLLLSMWRGMLHQPKDMNRDQVKITATSGWRAPQMLVPKRPFATSCPFIFGAFYDTQEAIDQSKGCPYNAHLTELERGGAPLIGVPGFTDCPRRVKADCFARLTLPDSATQTETFWPGFETREDPIPNNQTNGPNLLAKAIGNESALSDPVRVIAGERFVKALYLLAFRNEVDTNHPEDGFGAALFGVSEGPNLAMWEFRINGELVGAEHFQIRLGALGQTASDWSPDVNSYSGTAHCYGRIQGEFDDATASDYSGSIRVLGAADVRVYSDPDSYAAGYTTNRAWWLLHILAHLRWGYGQDYPRFDIQSFIDAAAWCDEYVTLTDSNGNTFSGVRSTFNAEVTARAIQQQVKDICTAGRLGIPFEFEGKDVVVPLKAEDVDDPNIPSFTDEGLNRNIVYDGAKSSLSWSVISDETMTNQWTVNFDDAANSGVDTQFIFGDQAQQLRAGRAWGDRSKRVVNKSQAGYGINSAQEAARFGNSLLYLGPLDSGGILNPFSVKFTTWYSEAFNVQNYKLIKVVNAKLQSRMAAYFTARSLEPYPGADFTCFRVMKYTRKGDLRVEIEAQQYATLEIAVSEPPASDGYIYYASQQSAWMTRAPLSDPTAFETIEFEWPPENDDLNWGTIAEDTNYVYVVSGFPQRLVRFSKTNWGDSDFLEIQLSTDWGVCEHAIVIDGGFAYIGFHASLSTPENGKLVKVNLSDFSTITFLDIPDVAGHTTDIGASIAVDGTWVYCVSEQDPSVSAGVRRISKSLLTVDSIISISPNEVWRFGYGVAISDGKLYISGSRLTVIDTATFAILSNTALQISGSGVESTALLIVGGELWVAVGNLAPEIAVYDKGTLAFITSFNLPSNTVVTGLAQDADFVYAVQSGNPSSCNAVRKSDYSVVSSWATEFAGASDAENRVEVILVNAGDADLTGFGPPRDLAALVNPATGQVQFAWAPPLLHPEVVTGYEMRDSAGNLVMGADLVYAFETTLAPGTYTYKVRATDGSVFSGYAIVNFTVPDPPVNLTLIDRESGAIFVDRGTGEIMVSRALPGG